jgi:hypothetical protein
LKLASIQVPINIHKQRFRPASIHRAYDVQDSIYLIIFQL